MAEEDEKQMMPYNEMQMAELAGSANRQLNVNFIYVKDQTVVNEQNMTTNIEGSNIEKFDLGQDNPDSKRKTAKLLNAADEGYNPEMVKGENPADITWLSSKVVMFNKRPINCRPTSNSKVYHGRHEIGRGFYRDVAIKLMQYSDKNLREIRTALKLTHPNIVQIFHVGEYHALGHWIYIVMELCSKNLEEYVTDNHINSEKALLFSRQIVLAVKFMHNRNIAHRDIKPSNILISQCGSFIKISDFGISKDIPFGLTSVTDTSQGAGSEGYKPPELYDPNYKVSLDSDIFSLGLVIVYLLSHGRHPFGDNPFDWGYKIRNNLGFDLSSIPYHLPKRRELIDLIKQMLEHNRLKRPTIRQVAKSSFFCENRAEGNPGKSDSIPSVESKSVKHDNETDLTDYEWYRDISRQRAEEALLSEDQEGYFIIRPSPRGEKNGKPYSLTLYHQQTNWNFHVRLRDDKKYAVGLYNESEACFDTLAELVDHYKHTPFVLGEQEREVLLVGSPQELYSACL